MATVRQIDSDNQIMWRPQCGRCWADLVPKDGQAICVMCNQTWELEAIGCTVYEPEPAGKPDPVAVQENLDRLIGSPDIDPGELPEVTADSISSWVTDAAGIQEAQTMFEVWMDGYTSEPNARPEVNIQAVMQFLSELLTDQAISDEKRGITDTYAQARDMLHRIYQARYQAKVNSS